MHVSVYVHIHTKPMHKSVFLVWCLGSCGAADFSHGGIIQDLAMTTTCRVKVRLEWEEKGCRAKSEFDRGELSGRTKTRNKSSCTIKMPTLAPGLNKRERGSQIYRFRHSCFIMRVRQTERKRRVDSIALFCPLLDSWRLKNIYFFILGLNL